MIAHVQSQAQIFTHIFSKLLTSDKQEDTFGPKIMFIDNNENVSPQSRLKEIGSNVEKMENKIDKYLVSKNVEKERTNRIS